ncbi:hypothetical protein PLICRDRAFT_117066, partial [Plicaturopsis crispa FD-325 SS-3]
IFSCIGGIFACIGEAIMAIVAAIAGCLECIVDGESAAPKVVVAQLKILNHNSS